MSKRCHRHDRTDCSTSACRFDRVEKRLADILNLLRRLIMTVDQLNDAFDAATTQAATDVASLIAAIKSTNGQVTAEQSARADTIIARLKSLGADASNPVPDAPPATGLPPAQPALDDSGNPIT